MTDSPTTEAAVETEPVKEETGGSLRAKLEEALAENKTLKAEKLDAAFTDIGLSPTTGLGKAIAKEYDGAPTTEALAEYAKIEYEWEKPVAPVTDPPVAQEIATEQAALDAASQTAGSVPIVPSEADDLAAAEAAGDYQKTLDIKSRQIEAQIRGR